MRTVIVDGNNLLHKTVNLKKLFRENPESAQLSLYEQLKSKLHRSDKLVLVFDGFSSIKSDKIIFAGSLTADEVIRKYIEVNYQKRTLALITSDNGIISIAEKCGVEILKSEDFAAGTKTISAKITYKQEKQEKPESISRKDFNFFKDKFK
ncbi:MAG: NYN domain-containing protein [Ignavibacteria bacterium]|jgi:predicted RNA-binding protein with PIN domain|nr:NYN domain-containing protein [Ignavibacteria bacterium]